MLFPLTPTTPTSFCYTTKIWSGIVFLSPDFSLQQRPSYARSTFSAQTDRRDVRDPQCPTATGGCSNKRHSRESSSSCAKRSHQDDRFYPPEKVSFNQWIISFIPRRETMVVFIHRRKGFFHQWIISFIPRRNDGCFYPPEKVLFTDGFTSFITSWKRRLFLSNGERTFLPLNFLHYRVERMVVYPPEKRLVTNSFTFIPRLIPRSREEESDLKTRSLPPKRSGTAFG